ncbi:MAG: hypothetical protein J2P50_10745 [Hyphomicrobiaceae bacterium]|nr:hypothetical protein [Hyphomicrobiaceae bacterium]
MRKALGAAAAALLAIVGSSAAMAARTDCQPQALRDLQRLSPQGRAIYDQIGDKRHFLRFLTCEDVVLGLATAVHESVHLLTSEKNAYPLINGGIAARATEDLRFFPPRAIARHFSAGDVYVQSYLKRGSATSNEDFRFLLDELNAYSHDLNSAVKLASLRKPADGEVGHRDGLASLMSFVMSYVDTARQSEPGTWANLQRPEVKETVRTLWAQAEAVLASACSVPHFGQDDRRPIAFLADASNGAGLAELLGRAPLRPCQATASSGSSLTR